jgi:hypothetical protein
VIAGCSTYEAAGHWGGKNPWDIPLFVVTHRPAEQPPGGEFIFVGNLVEAIDQAKAAAGGKQVHVMGGADLIRQALAAGLVDELTIIIAPVILGAGRPRRSMARGATVAVRGPLTSDELPIQAVAETSWGAGGCKTGHVFWWRPPWERSLNPFSVSP